jgi:dihydropteroate synthase
VNYRPGYEIRFADGGVMTLGPQTRVMGILNVTPDSFSAGGRHDTLESALEHADRMVEQGADIIDVGGESTRPGAQELDPGQEAERVLPVIEGIKTRHEIRVSIDTVNSAVARQALDAGADMINDISALGDPAMLPVICERRVPVVLMHMRGSPRTMQRDTHYDDLVGTIGSFLQERVDIAVSAGVKDGKILVDPGIGFGKSTSGNLEILRQLSVLGRLGRPILLGASRKAFIGKTLNLPVEQRLEGSLAVAAHASANGVHVIRAHDVSETVRVVRMVDAIREA